MSNQPFHQDVYLRPQGEKERFQPKGDYVPIAPEDRALSAALGLAAAIATKTISGKNAPAVVAGIATGIVSMAHFELKANPGRFSKTK